MKFALMNGWKDAPHCWRVFLSSPPKLQRTPVWTSLGWMGFVVFWWRT
jgi:hypothetical protein